MQGSEGMTEFDGGLSCIYRHHERIKLFYDRRTHGDIFGMFTELQNIIGDLVPEMTDDEYKQYLEDNTKLRNNLYVYMRNKSKEVEFKFSHLINDTFDKYMRLSKKKGMLQRNSPSMEELFF